MAYFVNGHEVKVGQVWRTAEGETVKIIALLVEEEEYPIVAEDNCGGYYLYTSQGWYFEFSEFEKDLLEPVDLMKSSVPGLKQPEIGQKHDQGKLRPTLLFQSLPNAVQQTIEVLQYGANKYGDENWKLVEPQRYKDALLRHILKYISGIERDEESGLKELAHISSNVLFLLEHEAIADKEKN